MAKEIGTIADVRWPNGVRLPVALTFEHQSGEGVPLLPGDRPNAMIGGAVQYGARTGIWNILEVLDKLNVNATFFVCGTTAEKYPDAVKAAAKAGHEIAGMSYQFDRIRTAHPDRERGMVKKTVKVLQDIGSVTIKGWRCPDYRVSPQTLDILSSEGFAWVCAPAPAANSRIAERTGKSILQSRLNILLVIWISSSGIFICFFYSGGTFGPARKPPSRTRLWPVMKLALVHIHTTASATSLDSPNRFMG